MVDQRVTFLFQVFFTAPNCTNATVFVHIVNARPFFQTRLVGTVVDIHTKSYLANVSGCLKIITQISCRIRYYLYFISKMSSISKNMNKESMFLGIE